MLSRKFETPFGFFEVLHNGQSIDFSVEEGTYNTMYLEDDVSAQPDGCYAVKIETAGMKPGDVVIARYSTPGLDYDGGDEHTLNAVAELEHFTIGIGCDDTDDLEELWEIYRKETDANSSNFKTPHMFPYGHWGITEKRDGFEFRITDEPKNYLQYADTNYYSQRTVISLSLVWNKNEDPYAWDIVSFLTC